MRLFSIITGKHRAEFSVEGIANVAKKTVKFQGHINGIPFVEGPDYEEIRQIVFEAVELNKPEENVELS